VNVSRVLDATEKSVFRTIIGKLIWMINDRPDIAYAAKELARTVQQPTVKDMMAAKRVLRYLQGTMNKVLHIAIDKKICADQIDVMVDASWANSDDRKSTSGGVLRLQEFLRHTWSKTQSVVAQSSCEAELLALNTGAVEGKLAVSVLKELNRLPTLILTTDSSSAANSTKRRGLGRMRHMDIRELWLQDEVRAGAVKIEKIDGLKNTADMLTKALPRPRFNELSALLGLVDEQDDKEMRRSE
jgi:hypothetical protein